MHPLAASGMAPPLATATDSNATAARIADPQSHTGFPGSPTLNGLVAETGESWNSFRRRLAPRYGVAWRQLAMSLGMLVGAMTLQCWVALRTGNTAALVIAAVTAVWIGYWVATLICFMHEAAHYNLHSRRAINDTLANLLLCPLIGEEITHYRAVHWQHHLYLGSPEDTEVSYHHAPTPRFMLETLTGMHLLRVLLKTRRKVGQSRLAGKSAASGIVRGIAFHGVVLATAITAGLYSVALAWIGGVFIVYPFFHTMRQVLEHRSVDASSSVDYTQRAHGPVNRMFGLDLFSRTFGTAGFNRHLLHHWYPAASYTRFDDLEAFLMRTQLAATIDAARSTYFATLRQLMAAAPSQ